MVIQRYRFAFYLEVPFVVVIHWKKEEVIRIGLRTRIENTYPGLEKVNFCTFTPDEQAAARKVLDEL